MRRPHIMLIDMTRMAGIFSSDAARAWVGRAAWAICVLSVILLPTAVSLGQSVEVKPSASGAIPAGTLLYLRLETPVSTTASRLLEPIAAEVARQVIEPSSAKGASPRVVIPVGAKVQGYIQTLIPSSNPSDRAEMMLRFDRLELPGHAPMLLAGHLKQIENARETVQPSGMIVGVLSSEMPASLLESALAKLGKTHPQIGPELQSASRQWLEPANTAIGYAAGTDMVYVLDQPLRAQGDFPPAFAPELTARLAGTVQTVLAHAPQRVSSKTGTPGDPINLMFIGSEPQLQTAFHQAGWSPAEKMNKQSIWDAARAMIADQGYHQTPLSTIYLFGRPEDLAFEKMLNTVAKRHHLRLWRSGFRTPGGRDVWLAAGTHDDGIDIHPGVISHAIAPNLDDERSQIGADMAATGRVAAEQLVVPPHPLSTGLTATGGRWQTDGRILVINFKPASGPAAPPSAP